jgi:hypothetical protein
LAALASRVDSLYSCSIAITNYFLRAHHRPRHDRLELLLLPFTHPALPPPALHLCVWMEVHIDVLHIDVLHIDVLPACKAAGELPPAST